MSGFEDPAYFGELWAHDYDEKLDADPTEAVDFLAQLAAGGRVLELAIGTGRVAVPLAARGLSVEGVEGSAAMVERMRAKPGGRDIPVAIGDMAAVPVTGPFRLVYLVFNTLFNLLSQEQQVTCFRNVAGVLEPDGVFVVEAYVPHPARLERTPVQVLAADEGSATIEVYRHDAANQRFNSQKITFDGQGVRLRPHAERYCWPSELDLMAQLAGLRLKERHADWSRRPFGSDSTTHVSVYGPRT
ncbi:class I SAM-dependent methyltransferase [Streptomyces sp. NPDC003077]|uniref:class I SAM-dependent DNA methyltransferase n=1 Tax=Streptomyces sp. NPDC003077 TaxID=3154443 RepID=UPI0033A61B1D